jgi:iron complex outermembrane receptor protein
MTGRLLVVPLMSAVLGPAAGWAQAQDALPVLLDPVVVSAQRSRQPSFDAPAAVSGVTRDAIEDAGPQVNLSESLNRVPGISVLNRQNYAQDLQLSIRGFGARSTFGIRGVRLLVDGIPATMPDGQGQASSIDLSSAGRIEVLRGPLAQLYGNAAGGVVQVFTQDEPPEPTATGFLSVGSFGQRKLGLRYAGASQGQGLTVAASQFETDGYRAHSDAKRGQLNARWHKDLSADTRISVVLNALDQPTSHDPLGLTRAQWQADPRQAPAIAVMQDARKSVRQHQAGVVVEHSLSADTTLTARLYTGARDLDNALSTPLAAQAAPTSSGGIVRFSRAYSGVEAQVEHRIASLTVTAGVDADRMREDRQGYVNDSGAQGELKRDERNTVSNADLFAQASWTFTPGWTLTAGARHSRVRFRSDDHFIATGNPDDSGGVDYTATNPVLGLAWRARDDMNVYANLGRGFETPTFTELAYRSTGTGLNTDLQASRSRHAEAGLKWKLGDDQRLDLAVFDIATSNEIVVDTNNGGRTTYKNAGRTTRRGVEASYAAALGDSLRTTLSFTQLKAVYADAFVSGSGAGAVPVPAGNRLPGTPQRTAFAELVWTPRSTWQGFHTAIELVHTGRIFVNDINDDAAPAATVLNLRAGLTQTSGAWQFKELLRIDNANDRRYAGSVIVNDANKRYFEPALPRTATLMLTAQQSWK